ncbi:MAG: gamma-glutamyl-phosphate reductase, partial [Muribaculaceae bacterium]|nr:gamma-glutamyl-phosphate reductase [Muribaculaceae bacterium]
MKQTVALIRKAKEASRSLLGIAPDRVAQVLAKTASRIVENADFIIAENRKDLLRMDEGNPDYDRLRLSPERVADIASDMLAVSRLPEPYGRVLSETVRPNGMRIAKVSVPFGVIGVIYEARPNVTADVFGLCFRAGSACVLKGGHDADLSSRAIVNVIHAC